MASNKQMNVKKDFLVFNTNDSMMTISATDAKEAVKTAVKDNYNYDEDAQGEQFIVIDVEKKTAVQMEVHNEPTIKESRLGD